MIIGISGKIGSGKDTVAEIIRSLIYNDDRIKRGFKPIKLFPPFETKRLDTTNWKIKRFADKLKDIVCLLIGCTRKQLEDREFKEKELGEEWDVFRLYTNGHYGITDNEELAQHAGEFGYNKRKLSPRLLLQLIGTECGREIIHPNIWVNSLFADYKGSSKAKVNKEDGSGYIETWKEYPNWIIPDVRFPNETNAIKDREGLLIRVNRLYCPICSNTENFEGGGDLCNECGNFLSKGHPSETALDNYNNFDYTIINDSSIEDLVFKVRNILVSEGIIKDLDNL